MKKETLPVYSWKKPKEPLFVLLVEDDKGDAFLTRKTVYKSTDAMDDKHEYYIDHVSSLKEAVHALEESLYVAILLDLQLPDARHLEAVDTLNECFPDIPIIILTNSENPFTKYRARSKNVQNYIYKKDLWKQPKKVAHALDTALHASH